MALKTAKKKVASAADDARGALRPTADVVGSTLADTRDRVLPVVSELASDARDRLAPALDDARKRIGPALDDARQKVGPALDDARKRVGPALDDARKKVAPTVVEAKKRVGPAVDDARRRVGPALEDARDWAAPVAAQALEQGRYHSSRLAHMAAEQGRTQGQRAAIRMGLVEEPKKTHKLRTALLVLLGLAGVAAVVYKKFIDRDKDPVWTMGRDDAAVGGSHRTPATAPAPPTDAAHDVGGGELDESMASDEGAAARHAASLGTARTAAGVDEGSAIGTDQPVIAVPPVPADAEVPHEDSGATPGSNTTPVDPPTAEEVAGSAEGVDESGQPAKKPASKSASRKKKS